ncbi:MAG TPA: PilZ domain-containing protein [Desulfobacteraceae bacterium]|nr:PilZ domain-containing protein [Desulfobacteraceae bacterium]HDO29429.1 PilZ domain-containing protein [Desulfobacteraceae bacterium]
MERRRHKRFNVSDNALAFINNAPCMIQDISEGGMMLQSVVLEDEPADNLKLDIFVGSDNFYLQDVPVRLISRSQRQSTVPFSVVQVRCFGFQFGELTEQQKSRLDYFIARNTIGEA